MTRESGRPLSARLADAGVDRRSFLKFCAGITATLALPAQMAPRVAYALDSVDRPAVIWLEFQDCAGDTEAFLRSRNPSVADLLLGMISLDYHETVMAAAGVAAEKARDDAVARGGHLVIVEGSIPTGIPGSCTVGGRSAEQILRESVRGAAGIINVGTCSAFGGIPAAGPNPTGAVRVEDVVSEIPVVNLTGCPVNADNLTATIVHFLTFGEFPARDRFSRPLFAYGERIHDTCQRRGHFDAGQFAEQWGDEGHRRGWCLYRLGCKGPSTFHNCPSVRFNGGTSWPVAAGHGCVGCSEPSFWDSMSPFYDRLPHVATSGLDLTADQIGVGVLAATATGFAAHGVGKVVQHRVAAHRERQAADRLAEDAETPAAETDGHGDGDGSGDGTAGAAAPAGKAVPSSETDGGRETGEVK
ncbi:hydrogenase [Parafrankia colletiae]|uniref:Hydrogenase n=1 Tax=Parafrankia colletiae TaxID=573497 RepID=A0A1S1QG25_9ACTN|nr:hydrogenase small subunit [Parafrankia colletiae]MCK9902182.1 hydrogenase small subunit [Frankia sp. Cpl3]OHV32556.1 hydrogenase [Parafrankia colletiae]